MKALSFHFSLLELQKPTLAGPCYLGKSLVDVLGVLFRSGLCVLLVIFNDDCGDDCDDCDDSDNDDDGCDNGTCVEVC